MKTPLPSFAILLALLAGLPAGVAAAGNLAAKTVSLFNGRNLDGWTAYTKENVPDQTWSVADGVIRCTGRPNGYIRTIKSYGDYRLTVEWRWVPGPAPTDAEGKPRARNSGVLLHVQGGNALWPKSLEAQLMENNAGDFYAIDGFDTDQHRAARDKALAAAGADEQAQARARNLRRLPRQKDPSEKPLGEWNRYEIICRGDSVTVSVNGVEQNRVTGASAKEGSLCLQAEGAPIEFRNLTLEPLD